MVARRLPRAAQLSRVLPIEMVVHHCQPTALKRPLLLGQGFIPDAAWTLLPVHQARERVRPGRLLLHCEVGLHLRLRPPSDTVRPRGLPFAAKDDHQLGRPDAEFEKLCGTQVVRPVAEDLGELGALGDLQVDGRLDVFLLLLLVELHAPGRAIVKVMFPVMSPDGRLPLLLLSRDQLGQLSDLALVLRALDPLGWPWSVLRARLVSDLGGSFHGARLARRISNENRDS